MNTASDAGSAHTAQDQPLAVIGMACRLPGASGPAEFWTLLRDGTDAIGAPPADRPLPDGCPPYGGYLDRVDAFDEAFFRISPREAAVMDPQQRLVLELGWEALEDAGLPAGLLRHTSTGVFLGAMADDYAALRRDREPDPYALTGLARGVLSARVSYTLGLRGPSLTVDTGQSSSLVAVHLACQSLRRGESRVALAGGVHLNLAPDSALRVAGAGVLSPDGRCRTFDAHANGIVRGEGGGVVVLKRLSDAIADGDRVHGLVLGSAVNNDGGGETFTTPDPEAQSEVIRAACADAGIRPEAVSYVELHGTGTPTGDPLEAAALGAAAGGGRDGEGALRVGSVKTNIGHLEGAAGVAGLLKALLSLKHRSLPASLHFDSPHPAIPLDRLGLRVQRDLGPWPDRVPPVAGVSSFGIGGTNCHVILTGAPAPAPRADRASEVVALDGLTVWPLSARTEPALRAQAAALADTLRRDPALDPADIGHSLGTTREPLDHRAVVTGTAPDLLPALDALAEGLPAPGLVRGRSLDTRPVMVFPGQGQQWVGMGRELLATSPVFAQWMERCGTALAPHTDWSLDDVLHRGDDTVLDRRDVLQPVLWALMVSLAELWRAAGVEPAAVVGHSQGEIAAAVVAGALSLEDGARTVALRARALSAVAGPGAGMLSLVCDPATAEEIVAPHGGRVTVAAVNGPAATVLSGPSDLLDRCAAACDRRGVRQRRVAVDYASHSPLMAPLEPVLADLLAPVTALAPTVPMLSTVTTRWLGPGEADGRYWYENLLRPVRLYDAVTALARAGHRLFVEVGPHPVLTAGIQAALDAEGGGTVLGTLRRGDGGPARFLASLAEAHAHGADVDWRAVYAGTGATRVDLPTYAFQRRRHWADTASGSADAPRTQLPAVPDTEVAEPVQPSGPDALSPADAERHLLRVVRTHAAALLGHRSPDDVDPELSFRDLGFDSQLGVRLRTELNTATGATLPTGAVFDHPTPRALARRLRDLLEGGTEGVGEPDRPADVSVADPREPIAIVAMSCRYAGGVDSPEALWDLLLDERDAVGDFPADRGWDLAGLLAPGPDGTAVSATGKGGFLDAAADFDAEFFGISPREAKAMDPQQRLLLETSWEAFERAGITPDSVRGTRTGVFVGAMAQEYGPRMEESGTDADGYALTGTSISLASGRISYTLGLEGPAVTVDTACSSSLVALHLAVRALRAGECDLALAGGATVLASPGLFVEFSRQGGLSTDGRCKAFAAAADGTGWGEGAGMLLVERLSDARRLGHRVWGVVRGSAVNQDGASNGLTAPSGPSQERLVRAALVDAGLGWGDVDAVEAHGTGTRLGDPIEASALLATYGQRDEGTPPVVLGSVKSNIGHTQAAAGVAGVIKMVMAMRYGVVPRTLHVDEPSGHVDWSAGAVELLTEARAWPEVDRVRRAGVSSFGISGTNAHVILEQAPQTPPVEPSRPVLDLGDLVPWAVSGRGPTALAAQAERLSEYARTLDSTQLAPAAVALAGARMPFADRAVVLARSRDELSARLKAMADRTADSGVLAGTVVDSDVVFVFPGQGAQWVGMGRELLASSPVFAASIAECEAALAAYVDWSLTAVLTDGDLDEVDVVQPVLWAVMVSLAALWRSVGVEPAAVVGHSQGEIAAACVAGALSLEDGARVVALRSKAIRRLAGTGGMVSVFASVEQAEPLLVEGVGIAAVNGPQSVVVSGDAAGLDAFVAHCEIEGIRARRVAVDYASHSAMVELLEEEITEALVGVASRAARVPMLSTYTGEWVEPGELDAAYWYGNLRHRVRLAEAVTELAADGRRLFVEVSPHPVLLGALQDTPDGPAHALGTLRRNHGGADRFVASMAEAWANGATVDWRAVLPASETAPAELPTYAFQRRRYWLEETGGHPFLGEPTRLADGGALFTRRLTLRSQPWLADHAVAGTVVVPGTVFLEAALHAGRVLGRTRVAELTLYVPLTLSDTDAVLLQTRVGPRDESGHHELEIHATGVGEEPERWTLHASSVIGDGPGPERADFPWPPEGADPVDLSGAYEDLADRGYGYGPAFRGLRAAWRLGDDVYGQITPSGTALAQAGRYAVHPALLDTALHAALLGDRTGWDTDDGLLLPFSWSGVVLGAGETGELRVRLRRTATRSVSLEVWDTDGEPVVAAEALALRPAESAPVPATGRDLYRTDWVPSGSTAAPGPCAVVGADPLGLAEALRAAGGEAITFGDLTELGLAVTAGAVGPGHSIALCVQPSAPRSVDLDPSGDLPGRLRDGVTRALDMVQQWLADERFADLALTVVTRGAVARDEGDAPPDPEAAAVWGLVRSAQSEQPHRLRLLDLDPRHVPPTALPLDPQACLRDGAVLVPRLRPVPPTLLLPDTEAWRLVPGSGDTLERLEPAAAEDVWEPLGPGQVRLAVRAAGINFRDVLISLGMRPGLGAALESDCAGVVTAVGPGDCDGFAVGDRVFGIAPGAFGPVAVTDVRLLARIPDDWSFASAATVPIAFLTAWYAWRDLARLRSGERVLVHAGTGGVGMAAIQLARHLGAEVYATAAPAKWGALRALGLDDDHIASSRDTGFAAKFPPMDVVLNSLTGEFVDASAALLGPGGRFVEMGKADIRDSGRLGVNYRAFDLFEASTERLGQLLSELLELFRAGSLRPLPVRAFDIRRAPEAFRYIQQARHIGKVVLTLPRPLAPDGTVLLTGGTGGLGALAARHLVAAHGVRHLLLLSRRGLDAPAARELAADLAGQGAEVRIMACDVADRDTLAAALATVDPAHPLTAVLHTAGVLDDGVIAAQDPARLASVLSPKTDAAWHLHELTAGLDLSAFVLYSSAMGVLGAPGQANYAAANAALDALAAHRRSLGLPALALAWGFWERRGDMTGHLDDTDIARLTRLTGLLPLSDTEGTALLDAALRRPEAALVPVRLSRSALGARAAAGDDLGLLHDLAPAQAAVPAVPRRSGADAERDSTADLSSLPAPERRRILTRLVRTHAATVLGHDSRELLAGERTFKELGFDSLTAVELRNRLATATGTRLAATMIYDHPTLDALTDHLLAMTGRTAVAADAPPAENAAVAHPLAEVERLESLLRALPADTDLRGVITTRIHAFLATWNAAHGQGNDSDRDDLDLATDEELFELLDSDFGLS
ncbi:type I polyketide synthase [Streptomyces sp. SID13726]|uniref:type I polyketide synthase n=1 Tax=Streptomyces sp. SID13726 TaxID=2706058 RepID=UPI0013B63198|nr:type I polyketide synthase [Streptomyces sp. SID13726]NEA99076.1 SDR family NAD(P)-dependent oxidoreductase [Streptomyces sp. SID13726]